MQLFLKHQVRKQFPGEWIGIVWDNAPSHRNHQIASPAYSAELDPAEQIFRVLRRRLANRIFETLEELQEALVAGLEQFWARPEMLIRFNWLSLVDRKFPFILTSFLGKSITS